jgi:hypothetical protein
MASEGRTLHLVHAFVDESLKVQMVCLLLLINILSISKVKLSRCSMQAIRGRGVIAPTYS